MLSKEDNIGIIINDEADEAIKKLFHSLKNKSQKYSGSMEGSEFFFDYIHLLYYYKCNKINLNHGGSYINYPDMIKNKKATINPINKNDN